MIDNATFLHEFERAEGRIGSAYDATVTSLNPFPQETQSNVPDAMLDTLQAPITSAMVAIYESKLNWRPDNSYRLFNRPAAREWDWGHDIGPKPQSVSFMRVALSLDPRFSVLIGHGMFDLITPYFATQLLLDQIPASAGGDRIKLEVYPGGHMFYSNDASRAALREAAKALIASISQAPARSP